MSIHETFHCGRRELALAFPDAAHVYRAAYPAATAPMDRTVLCAVRNPHGGKALRDSLAGRRAGEVVVTVSDITRPIPYAAFLPALLAEIEGADVSRSDIVVLIATGMHRPSTPSERLAMFGPEVVAGYRIVDHAAEDEAELATVPRGDGHPGDFRLNRRFLEAGFRFITGLVEPHFMAGFSGGRKAVMPGLAGLAAVRRFHGYEMLANPLSANGILDGNPCHAEALAAARAAGVDFSLNVVLDGERHVAAAFAGALEPAHAAACAFVRKCACPAVVEPMDVAVTSCGGYPLDDTFYQCVKGMVSCLPAVRPGGVILALGGCGEGIGGPEYMATMREFGRFPARYLEVLRDPAFFRKDQWQLQMQCRTLAKVGLANLRFFTPGLDGANFADLAVTGARVAEEDMAATVQREIDRLAAAGATFALFPEGPYCAPVEAQGHDDR
jgi:nickel-dependent lactate racemase